MGRHMQRTSRVQEMFPLWPHGGYSGAHLINIHHLTFMYYPVYISPQFFFKERK